MSVITPEKYKEIVDQHDQLTNLVIEKTRQLAFIQCGRYPEGIVSETDFEEKDGRLMVQFERNYCGDYDYDTYYLPLDALFDEHYLEKYKSIFEEEKRAIEEEKRLKKAAVETEKTKQRDERDRREYERLKTKFAKDMFK